MAKREKENRATATMLVGSGISVAIMLISLQLIKSASNYAASGLLPTMLLLAWTLNEALLVRDFWKTSKLRRIRYLISGGVYLVFTAVLIAVGPEQSVLNAAGFTFGMMLVLGRVFVIIENRSKRSAVLNGLLIALLLLVFILLFDNRFFIANLFSILLSMIRLITVAFSQIRLSVLKRIIRKTFAREILFGMLLLILAISIILQEFEPAINSFADGLWYCFAIVTTIGFGDITAVTGLGRLLSVILGIYGIIVVALITSIIVNFYSEVKTDGDAADGDATGDGDDEEKEETEGKS